MLIECVNCEVTVDGEVIGQYIIPNSNDPMDEYQYTFVKCPKCFEPVLMKSDTIFELNKLEWGTPYRIFPINLFHVNPFIPEVLRNALIESINCCKSGAYTATAIMCRRVIEGFCILKEVREENLGKSLTKLKEKGIINDQMYDWANQLRLTGNEAAHNIHSCFNKGDAKDILDFTIAILDFSYSFKDKFDNFLKRHNKNKKLANL